MHASSTHTNVRTDTDDIIAIQNYTYKQSGICRKCIHMCMYMYIYIYIY